MFLYSAYEPAGKPRRHRRLRSAEGVRHLEGIVQSQRQDSLAPQGAFPQCGFCEGLPFAGSVARCDHG